MSERSDGKLRVLNCARILAAYTLDTCKKDKIFPKSSRWIMAKRIFDECLDAISCITTANTYPVNEEYIKDRERNQYQARAHLNTMLTLLNLAREDSSFHLCSNSYVYWVQCIDNTLASLGAWMKSDRERMKKEQ